MISQRITIENVQKIANQISNLHPSLLKDLEQKYEKVSNKEFLIGLISGYVVSVELLKHNDPNSNSIDQLRAIAVFLCKKYVDLDKLI